MSNFAKIVDGFVQQVITISEDDCLDSNGQYSEEVGKLFCEILFSGGEWIGTSYNNSARRRFAGIGYSYDRERDIFVAPKPFPSWTLDINTSNWIPPAPYPVDGNIYAWNEEFQRWDLMNGA